MEFLKNEYLLATISIISFCYAIYSYFRNLESEKKLKDIEKAVTSFEYLRNRAFDLYKNGAYKDSIDTFKKYYVTNHDRSDLHKAINTIFWDQTNKIYPKWTGKNGRPVALIGTLVCPGIIEESEGEYPEILTELMSMYSSRHNGGLYYYLIPILLTSKKYQDVIDIIDDYTAYQRKETNLKFIEFIKEFCIEKISKEPAEELAQPSANSLLAKAL